MSLYDDVVTDIPGTSTSEVHSDTASNWSNTSFKMMQMQVEAAKKRQSLNKVKPAFTPKSTNSIAPVIDLSDKRGKPQLQLKKDIEPSYSMNQFPPVLTSTASLHSTGDVRFNTITGKIERSEESTASIYSNSTEEYDPMRPNDYEKLLDESSKTNKVNKENNNNGFLYSSRRDNDRRSTGRRKHSRSRSRDRGRKKERRRRYSSSEERSRSRSRRNRSRDKKRHSKRRSKHSSSSEDSDGYNRRRKNDERKKEETSNNKKPNNAFAPPPSLLENTIESPSDEMKKPEAPLPTKSLFGSLKAEKMMAKMGYKEGDGLGRNKQGMSIALQVEKTGKRYGRIIHEKDVTAEPLPPIVPSDPMPAPAPAPAVGIPADVMKNMSKVVLLRNMVGPGDVDDELEAETKEECAKYGEVNKCLIYEVPNAVAEEAVRIFLEFKTLPSAIKALTDLNGRFFGGRAVKATFYNFDKFKRLELCD